VVVQMQNIPFCMNHAPPCRGRNPTFNLPSAEWGLIIVNNSAADTLLADSQKEIVTTRHEGDVEYLARQKNTRYASLVTHQSCLHAAIPTTKFTANWLP